MSIVILVGGGSEQGNAEHRYLVGQFLEHFGNKVTCVITTRPAKRAAHVRFKRMLRRGNYTERLARALYRKNYGPDAQDMRTLLLPEESEAAMPGGSKVTVVASHNSTECHDIIRSAKPSVIVVYGTAIIHAPIFSMAKIITLNMHTGLSPFYRGDSTLFWPVYFNEPDKLGVTVHELVESVDAGDIAATTTVDYATGDTEATLFAKGVRAGTALYLDVVDRALAGSLRCTPQDLSLGREFSWQHRTVSAEKQVIRQLELWNQQASSIN